MCGICTTAAPCSSYNEIMKLTVENLFFSYQDGDHRKQIFDNISLEFEDGLFYCITGPSGCGKTTLLSLIGTIDKPESGDIRLNGVSIYSRDTDYRKNDIGIVFQNYNLIPYMTGIDNVALAMEIGGQKKKTESILGTLALIGVDEETARKKVTKVSGGEQQRIAIARAFINNPSIILADEPTGNLDSETSDVIVDIFLRLAHEFGKCIIMVTHNDAIAEKCDVEYRIENKSIITLKRR